MPPIVEMTDDVLKQLINEMTSPGGPFEFVHQTIHGVDSKVFKYGPRNLAEMYALGRDKDSFYARTFNRWFGDEDWTCMVYLEERYSFRTTYRLAAQLAWRIKERFGIQKGDRVAIAMRNYPEFCLAFMAATAIGALAVPFNAWWEGPELAYGLQDSEPKMIFADQQRCDRLTEYLKDSNIPLVVARSEKELPVGIIRYEDLIAGSTESDFPPADVDIDDDAYIMYTSGSTGRPKGVVTTHRAIINTVMSWHMPVVGMMHLNRDYLDEVKPTHMPSTLLTVPLFHVTGLVSLFLSIFINRRKLVIMYKWDAEEALRLIEEERITIFNGVPSMSFDLVNSPNIRKRDLSSLTFLGGGGAARPPQHVQLLEEILGRHIAQAGYGLTETTALGATNSGENYRNHPDSVGRPTPPLMEAKIVDENGRELTNGEIGEICFRSPASLKGYWKDPKATAEIFLDGGWLKTGDVGIIDDEGFVYIKDRAKDLVIRGGENIACREVEDAIYDHPKVFEAAVFGLPEEKLGEQVVAVIMVRPNEELTEQELKDFLSTRLAKFKIPSLIWFQNEPLLKGATGKIHKRALKEEKQDELS
ncbi:MAG: acyl--CoA ligase [Deltaproteobacteria bacterium]|nr:acyl--CoA ligase [Deltaproteobacteria bacterium]